MCWLPRVRASKRPLYYGTAGLKWGSMVIQNVWLSAQGRIFFPPSKNTQDEMNSDYVASWCDRMMFSLTDH